MDYGFEPRKITPTPLVEKVIQQSPIKPDKPIDNYWYGFSQGFVLSSIIFLIFSYYMSTKTTYLKIID